MNSHQVVFESFMGPILLSASENGLCRVSFMNQTSRLEKPIYSKKNNPFLSLATEQLEQYFQGARKEFAIPLDLSQGTEFQRKVWENLLQLKFGKVTSYKNQAKEIFGNSRGVRAVAQANARNPIAIIVPCHRVIASSGKLQGYASGLAHKESLLQLEGLKVEKGYVG
jgi:methylated-DNA-[protein]-cysteine S-methyltransferase